MAVEICERIGICNVDGNGSVTELQKEFLVRDGYSRSGNTQQGIFIEQKEGSDRLEREGR